MAVDTESASVTSHCVVKMLADGKSLHKELTAGTDWDELRSRSARPLAPCSRRARAEAKARVPVPPVTRISRSVEAY